MANPEHVEIVRQGAEAIAEWRSTHPGALLDLRDANLSRAKLSHSNLNFANLDGADLSDADLLDASLSFASLANANLSNANVSEADLGEVDLSGANFRDADLGRTILISATLTDTEFVGANLVNANLSDAELSGTNFRHAALGDTIFADVDLSAARGLTESAHYGPSTLDHRTLMRSGELPIEFLRGVGLPDEVIEFYRAQYGKPIQYFSSFISYARVDGEFVDRLHADLQDKGVRCWRDTEDMKIGDRMRSAIDRAIRIHDKVVLVLSERSIQSDWVESEVESALEKEREEGRTVLFPIRLDDSVMETDKAWAAEIRRTRNIGDFRGWKDHDSYQVAFQRVLRDLRPEAE